jgi:hypothetical protein
MLMQAYNKKGADRSRRLSRACPTIPSGSCDGGGIVAGLLIFISFVLRRMPALDDEI